MKLNSLIAAGLTATLLSTGIAYAQTAATTATEVQVLVKNEMIAQLPEVIALVEQLKAEGFTYIEIRRTMLGRAKILAFGADSMREVVMNANTGEIMRNVMREHDGSMAQGMEGMQAAKDAMEGQMDNMGNNGGDNMTGGMNGGMANGGMNGGMNGGNGGNSGSMTGGMGGN